MRVRATPGTFSPLWSSHVCSDKSLVDYWLLIHSTRDGIWVGEFSIIDSYLDPSAMIDPSNSGSRLVSSSVDSLTVSLIITQYLC